MINFQIGDTLCVESKGARISVEILDATWFTMSDELCCNLKINRTVVSDEGTLIINHSITMQELGRWLKDGNWQVQPGSPVAATEEDAIG